MACPVNVPILGCCVTAPPGFGGVQIGIFARAIGYEDANNPTSKAIYKRVTAKDRMWTPDGDAFATGVFETDLDGNETLISYTEDARFAQHKAIWGRFQDLTRTYSFSNPSPYASQVFAYNELAEYMNNFPEANFGSNRNEILPTVYRYSYITKQLTFVPHQNPDLSWEEHHSYLSSYGPTVAYSQHGIIYNSAATPLPPRVTHGSAGAYIGMSGSQWGATRIFLSRRKVWTQNATDPLLCASAWRPYFTGTGAHQMLNCEAPVGSQPGLATDGYYFPHLGQWLNHGLAKEQYDFVSSRHMFYEPTADSRVPCCRPPT